jgi:hypothetical protein
MATNRFAVPAACYALTTGASEVIIRDIGAFPQNDFALFFWAQSAGANSKPAGMLKVVANSQSQLELRANTGGALELAWGSSDSISGGPVGAATDGNWHHIAIQRTGSSLSLLLDGIPLATGTFTASFSAASTLSFGEPGTDNWSGAVDSARLYNRGFTAAAIPAVVYQWTNVKPSDPANDAAAFYPFNGTAKEANGKGIDGIVHGATLATNRFGAANSAYAFDGLSSYINLTYNFDLPGTDFALAFWAQSSSTSTMTAVSVTPGGTSVDIVFNRVSSGIAVELNGAPVAGLAAGLPGQFTDGNWHFVAVQQVGANIEIYVDGTLRASAPSDSVTVLGQGAAVQFGTGSGAGGDTAGFWNGSLDDIQIYGNSFAASDVAAMQSMQFLPRDGAGVVTLNGKMWLLGGWNPGTSPITNSEVWSSPDGVAWTFVSTAPWQGRHAAGWASFDNKLWVVGGDDNSGNYQNDVWSSPDGVSWTMLTDSVPWANRATQYVLPFNGKLWLMGGQQVFENSSNVVAYNDVYSSVDGINWELVTANAGWSPRGLILGHVVFNNLMWVIGGGLYDNPTYLNDVWSSADGKSWTNVSSAAPWVGRHYHNTFVYDNKIWVIAGATAAAPGGTSEVWYSSDGVLWVEHPSTPWPTRHAAAVWTLNNQLWIMCGSNLTTYDDVWSIGYAP